MAFRRLQEKDVRSRNRVRPQSSSCSSAWRSYVLDIHTSLFFFTSCAILLSPQRYH
jgi:hypothetical protein